MPTTDRITTPHGVLIILLLMCNEMSVPGVVYIIQLINERKGTVMMKIKPVESIQTPSYPDKYNEDIRHVLRTARPCRWNGKPLAVGVLSAAIVLSMSGCKPEYTTGGAPIQTPTDPIHETRPANHNVAGEVRESTAVIQTLPYNSMIPLFEYGDGTGAIGCVSIAAPVFMSEEEAYAIIATAFDEAGVLINRDTGPLENFKLPVTSISAVGDTKNRYDTIAGNLIPDGMITEHDLPVAFVSTVDVSDWETKDDSGLWVSVSTYDVKKTAQTLAENNPSLVVFYDPVATPDYQKISAIERRDEESDDAYYERWFAVIEEESEAARAESERLLRLQVDAFLEWFGKEVQS